MFRAEISKAKVLVLEKVLDKIVMIFGWKQSDTNKQEIYTI